MRAWLFIALVGCGARSAAPVPTSEVDTLARAHAAGVRALRCEESVTIERDQRPYESCAEYGPPPAPNEEGDVTDGLGASCVRTEMVPRTDDAYLVRGCGRDVVIVCASPPCGGAVLCMLEGQWTTIDSDGLCD